MLTEEEKAAAAAAKAKKDASDEAARKAKADQESDDDDDDQEDENLDDSKLGWTKEQKAIVDGLRKENAKARVKNKELGSQLTGVNERLTKFEGGLKKLFGEDDQDLPPEQKIERLSQQNEQLQLATALKEAALEHGVGKADYEYFEFLVGRRLQELGDDEELDDDALAEIAKKAKAKSAAKSTSVEGAGPDPDEDDGSLSLEEFMLLGISGRSVLYQKDKALYEKLVAAEKVAKRKK